MIIKFSKFFSSIHDCNSLNKSTNDFIKGIERQLKNKLIYTKDITDYNCDLKLVYIESGGSEGLFLKNFNKLKPPYLFITSGSNNSLAASLEILTYLNKIGKKGEILHGSAKYIASRIKQLVLINKVNKELSKQKFGIIGKPSDWLISSIPTKQLVKSTFGISLIDIPMKEVEVLAKKHTNNKGLTIKGKFNKKELDKADDIYKALNKIVNKYKLTGLTTRCFDLLTSVKSTACLALAEFNNKKITATCEGDVTAMISMKIASVVGDGYVFQANPSRIDVKNNKMIIAHCTIPTKMLTKYKLDTHFESDIGVAIKGELKKTNITMFRLSSNLKEYFVAEGKIVNNLSDARLCRTQIEVIFKDSISSLLTKPCGNHHIIFYGEHKKDIETYLNSLGLKNVGE